MGLSLTERVRAGLGTFDEWKRDRDADIARAGANIQVLSVILDSPFNRLKPRNMSYGEFYELHYGVDPRFHGARLPGPKGSGGWSGKRLGMPRYDLATRVWKGMPEGTKGVVGTAGLASGAQPNELDDEAARWF